MDLWIWRKELNPFFNEIQSFFSTITLSIVHFENMTPRIEPDFEKYDSKNWTLFFSHVTHTFFSYVTQRIQHFFPIWLWEFNLFWKIWLIEINFFLYESQNETFFRFWNDSENWSLFLNITNRAVFWDDSKNWTFLEKVTLRIYCFWKLLNFSLNIDSKNKPLIFWTMSQRLGPFLNVTQRIPFVKYDSNGTFFFTYDTKNWLFEFESKNWTLFSSNMTQRIEPFIS